MSVTFGFYNALNHDRKYDAIQVSSIFDGIINDGIYESIGTAMIVKATSYMVINIGIGRAWFNHTWTYNDSILPLTVQPSELVLNRIDIVILEVDSTRTVRTNSIKIIEGTPAATPVAITLVNNEKERIAFTNSMRIMHTFLRTFSRISELPTSVDTTGWSDIAEQLNNVINSL